jgi:branched-chain amino acid transport system permease protein
VQVLPVEIVVESMLNGLLTGAVYGLVALGLTLVYGVLHIINFAHGSLLTLAMFAAYVAHLGLGLDPYVAAVPLALLFFGAGYLLQRLVIGPASRGEDANILLVTLGLSIVIENGLLALFRSDTRSIDVPYAMNVFELGGALLSTPRAIGFGVTVLVALALFLLLTRTDTGKAIRAVAKERTGAALVGIDVAHIYAVTFGIGTACLAIAACLLAAGLLRQSAGGQRLRPHRLHHRRARRHGIRPGCVARRVVHRRGGEPVGPLPRRQPRPDRHLRHLHPGAAGATDGAIWS